MTATPLTKNMKKYHSPKQFVEDCRTLLVGTYLAGLDWQLDLLESSDMSGPLVYFTDVDTGYLQVMSLVPDQRIVGGAQNTIEVFVHNIGYLVSHYIHRGQHRSKEQQAALAKNLIHYAAYTQNFAVARDMFGENFSLFVAGHTYNKRGDYELRPFAVRGNQLRVPTEVKAIFETAGDVMGGQSK